MPGLDGRQNYSSVYPKRVHNPPTPAPESPTGFADKAGVFSQIPKFDKVKSLGSDLTTLSWCCELDRLVSQTGGCPRHLSAIINGQTFEALLLCQHRKLLKHTRSQSALVSLRIVL